MSVARKSTLRPQPAPAAPDSRYFIVNPAGCIHEVDRDHAYWRLKNFVGWRMARAEEVAALSTERIGPNGAKLAAGEQRADAPICTPWTPDPDAQIDLEA